VDGGPEFGSVYFETLLARYECTKETRPAARPRFGSICERLFGTTNSRFVHTLLGNTQLRRPDRQVTKSGDPKDQACWTLGRLFARAQLSRRSVEIHFGRYRPEPAEDRRAFKSVLLTFQRHLPLATEPDLVGRWEELYERSVGCVGVLKGWLVRALAAALEAGESSLTRRRLERHAEPPRKLLSLAREIAEGEAAQASGDRENGELRRVLGLAAVATTTPAPGSPTTPTARRASDRPGQRRPTLDPVGAQDPVGAGRGEHGR
jgi:hypothetical protein